MTSQRFKDTRTGEIVTQVPISEIQYFEEFDGETVYACEECGNTDLHCTAWIEVNTDKLTDDEPPTDQVWCRQCDCEGRDGDVGWKGVHEIAKPDEPKKSDWLDDHLIIVGLPDEAAEKIKDRLRKEL